jgi:hypothetical protein
MSGKGGMSFSNNFIVKFEGIPSDVGQPSDEFMEFFCDEAQLPNVNTATGQQVGLYTGMSAIDYPVSRVYTEIQLGFMLDADLTILKFLNKWHSYIFGESSGGTLQENRTTRVRYRSEYAGTIKIVKSELGPNSTTERQPITYVLEQAYPYAIDAIPLQFGSSQITKVTAQFKYQRHYTIDKNITGVKGTVTGMDNGYDKEQANVATGEMSKTSKEPINWDPKVAAGGGTKLPIGIEQVNQGIA